MRVANIIKRRYLTLLQNFLRYFHVSVKEATTPFISFQSSYFFSLHTHFVFFLISYAPLPLLSFSVSVHSFKLSSKLFAAQIFIFLPKGNTGKTASSFYT
jgi:hypothetical protein